MISKWGDRMTEEKKEQDGLSDLFSNRGFLNQNKFKLLRYLIILILMGVFLMLVGNLIGGPPEENVINKSNGSSNNDESTINSSVEEKLERKLEKTLSVIAGAGDVEVNISLEVGPEYVYARNDQQSKKEIGEEDQSGGTRETKQYDNSSEIVVLNQGSDSKAVVKKKIKAKVRGVLVVAEGANNSQVKADLISAVEVGLGVESYKIKVLAKER
jgi:stage III sporulation protein AG